MGWGMAEGDSCHGSDIFKVTPGRVFIVPLDDEGKPHGEPLEWGPLDEVGLAAGSVDLARGFDWGREVDQDSGLGLGLDGGLERGPDGARMEARGGETWNLRLEFSAEISDETMALLMGLTIEEYRDLRQWLRERAWLERMTGLGWGLN